MDDSGEKYQIFDLRNKEFTFDFDVSGLPCGLNGALYFVEMPADGGLSSQENTRPEPDMVLVTVTASVHRTSSSSTARYDLQSFRPMPFHLTDFLQANIENWTPSSGDPNSGTGSKGACCAEMDIWEANSISSAFTPHPCNGTGLQVCESNTTCGASDSRYDGICDKDGCDFNSYRMGNETFYGPESIIDTASPFTVVTQFITDDNTDNGTLVEIRRIYVQDGVVIQNSASDIAGVDASNSITEGLCSQQKTAFGDKNSFDARGGLAAMGKSFGRGMVLVMSVWDDYAANMLWLDSTYPVEGTNLGAKRGTCDAESGVPATVEGAHPDATVKFSAIKFGALNSTFAAPV